MPELWLKIISTLIALGVLIFVHELGHFLACRVSRVGVQKFSIGFGPELLSWQGKETRYSISLIPFGGFVKPQGETYEEIKKRGGGVPGDYISAPIGNRFLILIGGVAMNFLFAYFLFVLLFMLGRPVESTTIGEFVEGYPASQSDLRVGDQVKHLNGKAVSNWQELKFQILESTDEVITFTVERDGELLNIPVMVQFEEGTDIFGQVRRVPRIGIKPSQEMMIEKYGLSAALVKAGQLELKLSALTCEALGRLVTGRLSLKAVSGPIGIVSMAGDAVQMGLATFLQFLGLLSVSLAVINILPIPALDGGHLFFLFIEAIFRKPVSLSLQERMTQIGFFFLMGLMLLVVYNDLINVGAMEKFQNFSGKVITRFYDQLEEGLTKRIDPTHRSR